MDQTVKASATGLNIKSPAIIAGLYMVGAGIAFAAVNSLTQLATMIEGTSSTSAAFWQYAIAAMLSVPFVVKAGLAGLKTHHLVLHVLRVIAATIGVQLWVYGLSLGVPIWQAIALIMTSTFFVTIGAALLLKEKVGPARWLATLVGFAGGMVILQPWADAFELKTLLPIGAAFFWAVTSLFTKELTKTENPQSITLYLLLLLTPINLALALGTPSGIAISTGSAIQWIMIAGVLVALAQWFITKAYSTADAAYVQPFDHLKLPFNVLAGFYVFGWVPGGNLWLGAALIIAASLFIAHRESQSQNA
ncbi:DMT family transporter [Maritalea sp.]|jgi:drug/metabolite transporter (DMT)-like permease|uniref:DMT family transporter n=1 Tax=Maritalea sp. TaxID=2003361 RepID=UPI0039E632F2